MNLKIKPFMPRSVTIASLVVLMVMMMFNADFLYHKAFAVSVRTVNNTDQPTGIVRVGTQIWVSSETGNTVKVWTTSGVLLGSIAATDVRFLFTYGGKVYGFNGAGLVLYEFDPLNIGGGINRTSGALTGCSTASQHTFDDTNGRFFCGTGASNTIKIVNLSTMGVTTSTTLNTGANACNVPSALAYDGVADALIIGCNTSDNVVVVEEIASSGTPDYGTGFSPQWKNMVFDPLHQQIWGTNATTDDTNLYNFDIDTTANTILLANTYTRPAQTTGEYSIDYDEDGDRIILTGAGNAMSLFDASDGSLITSIGTGCNTAATCNIFVYSNIFVYTVGVNTAFYYEVDLTGVPAGGGAGGVVPASVCYVDKNFDGVADYIFNDVGGPDGFPTVGNPDAGVPDGMCDWSGFGTTSPPPITDTGGGLACLTGIIPCTNGQPTDPNPQTNGIGYLLVIFLLAIMILLFGVAQMKLGLGIPDWLWMIGTFAVIGFATLIGWIDSTLFIIGAVIVAALGAVSFIKKFAGGF